MERERECVCVVGHQVSRMRWILVLLTVFDLGAEVCLYEARERECVCVVGHQVSSFR